MELKDKVIAITGGGRGIGQSIAIHCAAAGAQVIVSSRTRAELEQTQRLVQEKTGRSCAAIPCDVSDKSQIASLFKQIDAEFGSLYGLVAAAGIYGPIGSFQDNDLDEWERAVTINLMGTARTVHAALQRIPRQGRIVLLAGGGEGALPGFSSYVTGKGAIWRFTETLADELYSRGIYVNAIAPGAVNTRFLDEVLAAGPDRAGRQFYERSLKQKETGGAPPEKAAELALYLLSDRSAGLSGKILSALWDPYQEFTDIEALTKSTIFKMRRVIDTNGSTHVPN